ncbi:MAG: type I DNA topoisomerase [Lachnospiraceae bacterium]|nr:type I DNA topoisomerase [Lachnospiraceae bacterium]
MANYLVIVESPAKAKTINKFLGKDYSVIASNGHVRDYPRSALGIDIENDYEPKYITIRGKGEILQAIRREVKKADKIYLATDPDREGEAISWHLKVALKLEDKKNVYRITFNEITKNAVKNAIKNAREIDLDLVNAQQTRRMLDRMVGYRISPLLWTKVKRGLSAGRVQSVALKLLCDKEDEISSFISKDYYTVKGLFSSKNGKKSLEAMYISKGNKKNEIDDVEEFKKVSSNLTGKEFKISDIKTSERVRKSPMPFTTSTLQQDAANKLNFTTQKTMRLAQELYEGVNIGSKGTIGLITYLRTDSVRISEEAEQKVRDYITDKYGKEAYNTNPTQPSKKPTKIQDAHEAIRPSDVTITPQEIKDELPRDLFRLYQLIWKRFVASRMLPAVYETKTIAVECEDSLFQAHSQNVVFKGFLDFYQDDENWNEENNTKGSFEIGDVLVLKDTDGQKHQTLPPVRYTESSLVKTLEELGIGRPSTYAPTISTILARRYVTKEKKSIYVTELGIAVNDIMKKSFSEIIDVNFTANIESLLDNVEEGTVDWKTIIRNFYPDLDTAVKNAEEDLEKVTILDETVDEKCPLCDRNLVIKFGPHGKFLACPGFPECKFTKPFFEKIGVKCPECGDEIVIKKTQKGRIYYGCLNSENCNYTSWQRPSSVICPNCGKNLYQKGKKLACLTPDCGYITNSEE